MWLLVVMLIAYFGVFGFGGELLRRMRPAEVPSRNGYKVIPIDRVQLSHLRRR